MGRRTQLVPLILALALGGCNTAPEQPTDTELVIALKSIKDEWLEDCKGLGDRPGGEVGDLLQDFANASALGAECRERHNSFARYLRPLVQRVKSQSPP